MVLDWMRSFQMNTYLYAPKDDLKQRLLWRENYTPDELAVIRVLIDACHARGIKFIYAISPGLDIQYSNPSELDILQRRLEQMEQLGVMDFALLLDDIPDKMGEKDRQKFGAFASAHSFVANQLFRWLKTRHTVKPRFLFCPTPYCGRMQRAGLGGDNYLEEIGKQLDEGIDVFWTGPEIISPQIGVDHVQELTNLLRRPPLIWDNLHANDYDGQRFYCGPYAGRPLQLRDRINGILHNPNNEAPLNYVPWKTLSDYLHFKGVDWDPRESYLEAMKTWHAHFQSAASPVSYEDLILLGDCYYLPQEEGIEAAQLYDAARKWLADHNPQKQNISEMFLNRVTRLRNVCAELVNLKDRNLFFALHRRTWDLREEMDLLLTCAKQLESDPTAKPRSDYHLPGTYRGGMVAKLRGLLRQSPDGTFTPNPTES